jgi:putative ABC transport system permease protein
MHVNVPPLYSALRRNPGGALLVLAQIAITLAVLCNAASIVAHAIARMDRPAGFDTRDTFVIDVEPLSNRFNISSAERVDLAYLRGLPDVVAATVTNGRPLTRDGTFSQLGRTPGSRGAQVQTSMLPMDEQGLSALDVPLLAGRNFRADEVVADSMTGAPKRSAEIIVTESLAQALFPGGHALGGTVYDGGNDPLTIIGISRDFMGPQSGQPAYNVYLAPEMSGRYGFYELLARARPGRRDVVFRLAKQHIASAHPDAAVAFSQTLTGARRNFDADSRNMTILLGAVTALMIAVCCLGMFGLTAFNVNSRIRQIGVRRAVGARKRDIVSHFIAESALILGAGAVVGSVLALALGQWLSDHYGEPRLDLAYVLASVVTLWAVAQLAAWQPARRAASVPPSVATRTV